MGNAKKFIDYVTPKIEWRKYRVVCEYEVAVDTWQGSLKQEKEAWKEHQEAVVGDSSRFRRVKLKVEEVK